MDDHTLASVSSHFQYMEKQEVPDYLPEELPQGRDPVDELYEALLTVIDARRPALTRSNIIGVLEDIKVRQIMCWREMDNDREDEK